MLQTKSAEIHHILSIKARLQSSIVTQNSIISTQKLLHKTTATNQKNIHPHIFLAHKKF